MSGKQLSTAVMKLPALSRAKLAARLLASLDDDARRDVNDAWAVEAESRIDAFEAGKIISKPVATLLFPPRPGNPGRGLG